jgi:hypothetical protein
MLRRARARLSYANVIATLALFIALGGSSYAALQLPKNSIGAKQIKANAVTSSEVKAGSLLASDLKASARTSLRGQQGPKGDKGANGATNVVMRQGATVTVTAGAFSAAAASCNAGERATGGGVYNEANVSVIAVTSSYPTPNPASRPPTGNGQVPTGWRVWVKNNGTDPYQVEAYVICAAP